MFVVCLFIVLFMWQLLPSALHRPLRCLTSLTHSPTTTEAPFPWTREFDSSSNSSRSIEHSATFNDRTYPTNMLALHIVELQTNVLESKIVKYGSMK